MRSDIDGNLWCGWGMGTEELDGVRVFTPSGDAIGHIKLPERCANVTFGGRHRNRLFMAASRSLYALYVKVMSEGGEKPLGSLTEEDLDTLADAVFASLGHLEAGKPPTREHFDDLPITVAELVRCIPVVARAAGMISRDAKHSQGASDGAGK